MSTDLVAFILDRLDEDQHAAVLCAVVGDFHWAEDAGGRVEDGRGRVVVWDEGANLSAHIARHDPARVLREVEAKRRILREHQPLTPEHEVITGCSSCSWRDDWEELHVAYPCATVQLLAAPFANHPNYRSEWSPS